MARFVRIAVAAVAMLAALLFSAIYYEMYWRWRGCFNDEGRCFDPGTKVVYLSQDGMIYILLFMLSALVAGVAAWPLVRRNKSNKRHVSDAAQ